MTYVLYRRVDDYGKVEVVKESVDAKKLESIKNKLYLKKYFFIRMDVFLVVLFSVSFFCYNVFDNNKLGLFAGITFSISIIGAIMSITSYQHDQEYYIEYKG